MFGCMCIDFFVYGSGTSKVVSTTCRVYLTLVVSISVMFVWVLLLKVWISLSSWTELHEITCVVFAFQDIFPPLIAACFPLAFIHRHCFTNIWNTLQVMMNAMNVPSKRSTLEKKLDKLILTLFATLFMMCFIGAVGRCVSKTISFLALDHFWLLLMFRELYDCLC